MDSTQTKIIELLREVHLLALKEMERLNLRIAELENNSRQQTTEIAKLAVTPAPISQQPHPEPTGMMNEHEVAAFLKMSVASVRRWRLFRTGPKFVKVGAAVRYKRVDLEAWVDGFPRLT